MPFQSEKQRRFLHANHPEIAKRWESEYATGGISNHFRRKFASGTWTPGAGRDTSGYQKSHPSYSGGNGGNGGGGGNGGTSPIHTGPSPAELAAQKKAAAAAEATRLQALENARSKQIYDTTMAKRKKNIKYYDKTLKSKFDTGEGWDTEDSGIGFNMSDLGIDKFSTDENIQLAKALNIENLLKGDWSKEKIDKSKFEKGLGDAIGYNKAWKNVPEDITKGQFIKDALDKKYGNMTSKVLEKAIQKGGVFPSEVLDQFPKSSLVYGSKVKPTVKYDEGKMFIDVDEGELESDALEALTKKGWLAKGGVARKNYFHGGILGLNESEEIISDDGNDIELTDYNAAFDDPNDLSTGVKSLFMKKGGNVRLGPHTATDLLAKKNPDGTRSKYQPPGGGATSLGSGRDVGRKEDRGGRPPGGGDPRMTYTAPTVQTGGGADMGTVPDTKGNVNQALVDAAKKAQKRTDDLNRRRALSQMIKKQQLEKGPIEYYGANWPDPFNPKNKVTYENKELLKTLKNKLEGDWQKYVDPTLIDKLKLLSGMTGITGILTAVFKQMKTDKEMKEMMTLMEGMGLAKGPPGTNHPMYDKIWLYLEKKKAKYRKDGEPHEGPEPIYAPLTGAVGEEYAQGLIDPRDWMAEIRAKQAARAAAVPDWQLTADEAATQGLNSGGLANLFRVKNQ